MIKRLRQRVFEIVGDAREGDTASRVFDIGLLALILTNVLAVVLQSVGSLATAYGDFFHWFEVVSVVVFTVEYVLRLWTVTLSPRFERPLVGRLQFARTPMALVDLIAILPFYIPTTLGLDLRVVRALRLFRVFRLFKLSRYSQALGILVAVVGKKREELTIVVTFAMLMLVLASTVLYYVESPAQPEQFSSIPASMWWGVCTLTTVGYGDIYPVTALGKFLGAMISVIGVGLFALPAGILASGFTEEMGHKAQCPHCDETL